MDFPPLFHHFFRCFLLIFSLQIVDLQPKIDDFLMLQPFFGDRRFPILFFDDGLVDLWKCEGLEYSLSIAVATRLKEVAWLAVWVDFVSHRSQPHISS